MYYLKIYILICSIVMVLRIACSIWIEDNIEESIIVGIGIFILWPFLAIYMITYGVVFFIRQIYERLKS